MSGEKSLFTVALAGFSFLAVGILGGVFTAAQVAIATVEGWTTVFPGLAGGTLAAVSGVSGYILAREHSRAVLEREGLLLELEGEFASVRDDTTRLGEAQGRLAERARLDGDTIKEFVKESRVTTDQALALIEAQKAKIAALEARIAELELAIGVKNSVRVGVSR